MKTLPYRILVGLMGLAVVGSLAGFMKVPGQFGRKPEPVPVPEFRRDASDIWDKTSANEPSLAPGAAIRIATKFMRTMRLPDFTDAWVLDKLTLQPLPLSGGPEEWVYLADFHAEPGNKADWRGPVVRLQVPVRLNGGIPETFSAKIPEAQRFTFWRELLAAAP